MKTRKIVEVAKLSGTGIETIRFYEREGLLQEPERRPPGGKSLAYAWRERGLDAETTVLAKLFCCLVDEEHP